MGGSLVVLDFDAVKSGDNFHRHRGINSWFVDLVPWIQDFYSKERIGWLDIEGVPDKAWTPTNLKKIV